MMEMPSRILMKRRQLPVKGVLAAILTATILTGSTGALIAFAGDDLRVGMAETDITPPIGFPIAGYFHERLATGTTDPLKAKAIVFRGNGQQAALVVCDVTGVSADLAVEIRKLAEKRTGIPAASIAVSASHSHTGPDYYRTLHNYLQGDKSNEMRAGYITRLIDGAATAIEKASEAAAPVTLLTGKGTQETPVAFNRRFVMRDGSIRTWMNYSNPDVVRAAGPIDPEIGMVLVKDDKGRPKGLLSNFALHLDTVGGMQWSADYPYFIEQAVRSSLGPDCISLFGTGCCGDINHSNPHATERNKTDFIGGSLGTTIQQSLTTLKPVSSSALQVRQSVVHLPLQQASKEAVLESVRIMKAVAAGEKVDFFDHVTAHKTLLIDRMRNSPQYAGPNDPGSLLFTHQLAAVGENLPVEINVITVGKELAIVCLPGEVFVDLGLAIKRGSPFDTTLVVELSNSVETCYIPTRAAYVGGGYEVTNSTVQPGSGELMVEEALRLLKDAALAGQTASKP